MIRTPVKSKAVRSIGYDETSRVLEIEFSSGRIYAYDEVSAETHEWLMRAKNKGAYISRILATQKYRDVTPGPVTVDLEAALNASLAKNDDR